MSSEHELSNKELVTAIFSMTRRYSRLGEKVLRFSIDPQNDQLAQEIQEESKNLQLRARILTILMQIHHQNHPDEYWNELANFSLTVAVSSHLIGSARSAIHARAGLLIYPDDVHQLEDGLRGLIE